jgi:hypothetical protein
MATIGLKIRDSEDGGSTSLADTLAKAFYGDPEGIMKARVMASQLNAHQAYADNLTEKTREDKIAQGYRDAAGPAVGDAAAAAVPAPIVVTDQDALRRLVPPDTSYGPQFPHSDPNEVARVDALRKQERALGPILVNGNPDQVASGVNKNYGGAILSGAAGNPAIVKPDTLRLASTLYTGSAPTTSTVMVSGDNAGVDAKAREDILTERAKPAAAPAHFKDPSGNEVQWDPQSQGWIKAPGTGVAPAEAPTHFKDPAGNELQWDPASQKWIKAPGADAAPAAVPDTFTGPDGKTYAKVLDPTTGKLVAQLVEGAGAAPVKPVQLDEKSFIPNADGTGYVTPKTDRPLITEEVPDPGSEKGRGKIIRDVMALASQPVDPLRPNSITQQQALDYDLAFTTNYGAKTAIEKINGIEHPVRTWADIPAGLKSPAEIYKLAGVPIPQQTPTRGQPAGAPAGTAGQPASPPAGAGPRPLPTPSTLTGGNYDIGPGLSEPEPKTPTASQAAEQRYLVMAKSSNDTLSKITPRTMPSGLDISLARTGGDPGAVNSLIGSLSSQGARDYAQAASAFIEAYARPATGATISPKDYQNFYASMIPIPTDNAHRLKVKAQLREDLIQSYVAGGFPDAASRDAWLADWKAKHDDTGPSGTPPSGGKAPPSSAPQGAPPEWDHLSERGKALWRKQHGAQ